MNVKAIPKEDTDLARYLLDTFDGLKEERRVKEPLWKELTDYLYPRRSGWDFESDDSLKVGDLIFDGEAIAALNRLSHGLFGWLCSPSIDWLEFEPKDRELRKNLQVMQYCKDLEMHLLDVFARSNFYEALSEDMSDGCALGTAVMWVDNDEEADLPVFTPLHIREIYISENSRGKVDVLFRDMEMTCRQFLETFDRDDDNIAEQFQKMCEKSPEKKVRVLHCVYPTGMNGIFKSNMPYASVYLLQGSTGGNAVSVGQGKNTIIRKGGMSFQKFQAWRLRHMAGQAYGSCPGMDAIWDIKMINIQSKTMSDAEQLAAQPPMQTFETMKGRVKIYPGGITYHNGERIEPVVTGAQPALGMDAIRRRGAIIREHFMTDYFMSTTQIQGGSRERTKEEILQLKAESAAVLGAVVGRIQSERIEPMAMLTMAIEKAAGRLPLPPEGVDPEITLKIKFVGPLALAQRRYVKMQGISQGLAGLQGYAQLFGPDVMLNVKRNYAVREMLDSAGYPAEGLEDEQTVARNQKAAEQARAQAAQAAAENERLAAAGRGARAAEPGSPTEAIMKGAR